MMSWQYPPFVLLLVLSGIISATLAYYAWQRRPLPGTTAFALLMLAVTEWSLAYALSLMSSALPVALFWDKIVYLGTVIIGPAWLAFALQYTGRGKWLVGRNIALLAIIPLVTLALVWTNGAHSLIYTWTSFEAVGSFLVLNAIYGPWFWFHIAYTYTLLLLGTILLFRTLLGPSTPRLYWGQFVVVLIGVLAPWVTSALDLAELGPFSSPLDMAPFACTLTGLTVTWGLYSFRFLDIIPVARNAVVEGMRDGMIVLDLQGRVVDLNPAAQDLISVPATQAIGRPVVQLLHSWHDFFERYQDVPEAQAEIAWGRNGKQCYYDLRISPLTDWRGRLTGRLMVLRNITERVQAEEQLRRLKEFNEGIVQNMAEGIVVQDAQGYFTFVNPATAALLGYAPEEIVGLHWTAVVPPDQHPIVEAADERRARGESDRYELELVRKDGKRISVLVSGSPRFEEGRFAGTMSVFADITKLKRAEEALRESEARLRALIDHLPAEAWAMDNDLCFIMQNAASSRIVGNVVGKRIEDLDVPTEVKARWLEQDRRVLDGNLLCEEYQIEVEGEQKAYENFVAPVKVGDTIIGLVGVALDMTERKRAEGELRKHRDHLEELVKERTAELVIAKEQAEAANRAKSAFLASMSHELRTPLNAILGYTQIFKRQPLDPKVINGLNTVQQSGEHLLTLIDDILNISKIETGRLELYPGPIRFPNFLETIAGIVRPRAEAKGLHFALEVMEGLPVWVEADETRLRQVLLNLLNNAVKFTNEGQVTLRVRSREYEVRSKGEKQPSESLLPTPYSLLRFEVQDTGIGIPPDQLERIFEPFEQAEDVTRWTKGAGLGLTISRQLVQLMGGELRVESPPFTSSPQAGGTEGGPGSLFWFEVTLPVMGVAMEAAQPPEQIISGYRGPRRVVLVVDDVPSNRAVLVDLLKPLGFEVIEAADGQQAIHLAREIRPDLILMDRWMPGLDGFEAMRRVRQNPELEGVPIITVSASVSAEDQAQSREVGIDAFLPKPVNWPRLAALLQEHLGLEWEYEEASSDHRSARAGEPAEEKAVLVPPPQEELAVLLDLALRGDMRAIRERAAHVETLGEEYAPFARKLRELAEGFEERQIRALIERYMEEDR